MACMTPRSPRMLGKKKDSKGSMDPTEASKVGAKLDFSLCLSRKRDSILAKSVRPGGLVSLPQGNQVNREWLTSLEIDLVPLPEEEYRIP